MIKQTEIYVYVM